MKRAAIVERLVEKTLWRADRDATPDAAKGATPIEGGIAPRVGINVFFYPLEDGSNFSHPSHRSSPPGMHGTVRTISRCVPDGCSPFLGLA